jgi:heme A synthase
MFLVQTGRAKRTRKYSILMMFLLFLMGGLGGMMAIFTLHWEVRPKRNDGGP